MIRFEIARTVQSANAFVNRRGFGGSVAYRKDRDAWRVLLQARVSPQRPPDRLMRVQLVSYRARLIDHANLVGGAKGLIDCLRDLGLIRDDSPKWMLASYDQTVVPKSQARTVIIISDPT